MSQHNALDTDAKNNHICETQNEQTLGSKQSGLTLISSTHEV